MRAIIIAAGSATRWNNYLNTPKHLIKIDGESIIHRTVRLLYENNVKDIFVVGPDDDRYKIEHSQLYIPNKDPNNMDADKFLNSKDLWNTKGRTVVFYGDVYFTEDAISKIVNYDSAEWTLFCRLKNSIITGSDWAECFAQSFYPNSIEKHENMLNYIARLSKEKIIKRCGGWEHYRAMQGKEGKHVVPIGNKENRNSIEDLGNVIEIDDWTEDFDFPSDYDRFIERWNHKNKQ
jgi:hypothetical protein